MSIQAITTLWEAKRAQAQAKRREADMLEAEARGLQQALEALRLEQEEEALERQTPQQFSSAPVEKSRKTSPGRQPGAISSKWKRHLIVLDNKEELFKDEDVAQLVLEAENRVMKPSEVKRLFENFIRYGHVALDNDNFYYVPSAVVRKFKTSLRVENDDDISEHQNQRIENGENNESSESSDESEPDYEDDLALSVLDQERHHKAN